MLSASPVIGIDLGTSYSCVGVWNEQLRRVDIIPNEEGARTTPSCVGFSATGRLIGETAAAQAATNPNNTIFGVKRLMGRAFDDPAVQSDARGLPYHITNRNGRPGVSVSYLRQQKIFSPEEMSSVILLKMKRTAEQHLGRSVKDAVVTVPSHFNTSQRKATQDAAIIAGLNVLRIVNETSAAAMTYAWDKGLDNGPEHVVIMFNWGGGTLDVSLLTLESGVCEVKAVAGTAHLGGNDLDDRLVTHLIAEFRQKTGKDISSNYRALRRLRTACERAKRSLSSASQARIEIDALCDGVDFYTGVTRDTFERLCNDLLLAALEPVQKVLRDSKTRKEDINNVVLVGGSSRIPFVYRMLSDFFSGKVLNNAINTDEAAAYGATLVGALVAGKESPRLLNFLSVEVLPVSLGIETALISQNQTPFLTDSMAGGGNMTAIVRGNTSIPTKRSEILSNYYDNQNRVVIHIYEGESPRVKDNWHLGFFEIHNLPLLRQGEHQIEVTFDVDGSGDVEVSARDLRHGSSNKVKITHRFCLTATERQQMIRDAEQYEAYDRASAARAVAKNNLEAYIYALQNRLKDTMDWIEGAQNPTKEDFEQRLYELAHFEP